MQAVPGAGGDYFIIDMLFESPEALADVPGLGKAYTVVLAFAEIDLAVIFTEQEVHRFPVPVHYGDGIAGRADIIAHNRVYRAPCLSAVRAPFKTQRHARPVISVVAQFAEGQKRTAACANERGYPGVIRFIFCRVKYFVFVSKHLLTFLNVYDIFFAAVEIGNP
jgi:hypothetical protein